MNGIDANSEALKKFGKEIPDITQALRQQCSKLIQSLDAAAPYIKVGSGTAAAKKLVILRTEVEEMMKYLPIIEGAGETTIEQAKHLDRIINLIG